MSLISQQQSVSLFRWNLVMGFLHLIQASFMFLFSAQRLYPTFVNLPSTEGRVFPLPLKSELFLNINLGYLISSFLLFSAIAHFLTILPVVHTWYLKNLAKEVNLIRWWEYTLSSSVMIVVIAALCGISDAFILILLFSINACMNLFGAVMEKHNSALKELNKEEYKTDWTAYIYGVFAGIVPWIIMGVYFFTALDRASTKIPDFVYYTFPILFIFFNLFAINMFLQYKKIGSWKSYLFGEKVYIFLSLGAKTTLAWLIWGGTLRG